MFAQDRWHDKGVDELERGENPSAIYLVRVPWRRAPPVHRVECAGRPAGTTTTGAASSGRSLPGVLERSIHVGHSARAGSRWLPAMRKRVARIDAAHAMPTAALLFGCFIVLMLASCGGAPAVNESWTSGWLKDSAKSPVGDPAPYVSWDISDFDPAWSPDGRWIAFASSRSAGGIYIVHPNGRDLQRVWRGSSADYPSWSPNGRWIAFSTARGIVVTRRNGSARRLLVRRSKTEEPKWSGDGRDIAFAVELPDSNSDIYIKPLNGGHPRPVARSRIGVEIQGFDWSPTGRALALTVYDNRISSFDGPFVAVLALDTGSVRFLLKHGGSYEPAWSPNGARIAYQCEGEVCTIGANGGDRRVLTAVNGATEPAWSPDGRWIVFSREVYGPYVTPSALYRVSTDGRHLRNITFGPLTRRHSS
jgi:dipeptidyl aminopeptidase/acylaminoacyl peptidase